MPPAKKHKLIRPKAKSLIGHRFGRLIVIGTSDKLDVYGVPMVKCKCDCGNIIETSRTYLRNGHKKSCGCFQIQSRHDTHFIDLTGKKFDRLTVLGVDPTYKKSGKYKWICRCDCGNIVSVFGNNLGRKNTMSCGCLNREAIHERQFKDLTGQRFGRLTVIKLYDGPDNRKFKTTRWLCKCDCGNETVAETGNLMNGHTQSCGCLIYDTITTHKLTTTRTGRRIYSIYGLMKRRCYNPKDNSYDRYGGRGIYICDEWLEDGDDYPGLMRFYNWAINNGYADDLSIDRIDNDGPYAPWNCRWATNKVQANNKSTSRYLYDADGELLSYAMFEEKHDLPSCYVTKYLRYWSLNEIVFSVNHPELGMCKRHHKVVDKDGFTHLIPNYQNRGMQRGNKKENC